MLPKFLSKQEIFQDGKFLQILILSFSFMLLFTAFQTTCFIEQTVLNSVKAEDPNFSGNGYVSLCIIYAVFSLGSWIAPSIVAVIRSKWSMVCSAGIYLLFIAQFTYPSTWLLYLSSALLGGAASLLWCAQGNFLTLGSDSKTISRNSGVFWAINQCSLFFGNLFVFFQFHGKTTIDSETRVFVFIVLTIVSACGVGSLFLLKDLKEGSSTVSPIEAQNSSEIGLPVDQEAKSSSSGEDSPTIPTSLTPPPKSVDLDLPKSSLTLAKDAFKQAVQLFFTKYMLLLSVASIYTGWGQCFYFGVYSTSVGATLRFQDPKRLVGLIGIFTGIGEVAGGTVFGLLGSKTTKKGRSPVVFLGLMIHTLCYVLIYLNLPDGSPIGETGDVSLFDPPQAWLALFCALLLGFGDACYQTQLFSIFGSVYSDKSAAAFAIFKFTQSAASAIAFFSSSYMGIGAQMLTLLITAILGFFGIFLVEVDTKRKTRANGEPVSSTGSFSGIETGNGNPPEGTMCKNDQNSNNTSSAPNTTDKPMSNKSDGGGGGETMKAGS